MSVKDVMTNVFTFGTSSTTEETDYYVRQPYCVSLEKETFVRIQTQCIFERLLNKCRSKSTGLNEEQELALYDSPEKGAATKGVLSLIAAAMANRSDLYLVYKAGIARKATSEEQQLIREEYQNGQIGKTGVYASFAQYDKSDIVRVFVEQIYDIIATERVQLGLSQSLIMKMNKLRETVSIDSADGVIKQAASIAEGLREGKGVILDGADVIELNEVHVEAVKQALILAYTQLASNFSMPVSFFSGELTSGMSVTGDADLNSVDEGIKDFFNSVYRPIIQRLFNTKLHFRTDNYRRVSQNISMLPYIEGSLYIDDERKKEIIENLLQGV